MKIVSLSLSQLESNIGQVPELPMNPRQWTATDIDKTRDSVLRDPDFLEDRPLLVIPLEEKKWVVFAGNLRREGAKAGKVKEVPAVIYYPETEEDKQTIKRRAILDNGSFGAWDYDALANEWDDLPLTEWGVPAWKEEEEIDLGPGNMKETERLSGLEYEPLYFEPAENPALRLADCYNDEKFRAKVSALDEYDLTPEQKQLLTIFAYRFIKIDFEAVANYYYFNASEEEKKAIERLRLVLVDNGSVNGFIEDNLLRVAQLTIEQAKEMGE